MLSEFQVKVIFYLVTKSRFEKIRQNEEKAIKWINEQFRRLGVSL